MNKVAHQKLLQLFHQNNGYLISIDLKRNRALYYALHQMILNNEVEQLKRGLYHLKSIQGRDPMQEVAKIYPDGVFCLISAWHHYELSTQIPNVHHMAFQHKSKITLLSYPPIQAYFWQDKFYNLEVNKVDGIKIYSLEKSVCDAVKYRNKVGTDLMSEVLNNYLANPEKNLNKLMKIAELLKIKKNLHSYLDVLL